MNRKMLIAVATLNFVALAACNRDPGDGGPPAPRAGGPATPAAETALAKPMPDRAASGARAELQPASGSKVSGTVTFAETAEGVQFNTDISGLTPGKHGFHVHEKGDCSAPDATSAGAHFNPDSKEHGGHDSDVRHRGDLGNIEAGRDGRAQVHGTIKGLTLQGPDSIVGKALLVHAGEDDLKTPPSGNSGARVACGVIQSGS